MSDLDLFCESPGAAGSDVEPMGDDDQQGFTTRDSIDDGQAIIHGESGMWYSG